MKLLARAFPVRPGMVDEVRKLADEVHHERRTQADEFYRRMGIGRETWHLQHTPAGALVIVCTEVADLEHAAQDYGVSQHPFDAWLKQQVKRLSGIDPNEQPAGPPSEQVFEWNASAEAEQAVKTAR